MSTLSADAQQLEKMIAKEAKADERTLQHVIKDLQHADKSNAKAGKVADKAVHGIDKAISKEQKLADRAVKAEHKHNVAVNEVAKAEKNAEMRKRQQVQMGQELQQKRATVDDFQHTKDTNDQQRESRLAEMHQRAAAAAAGDVSRNNTINSTHTAGTGTEGKSDGGAGAPGSTFAAGVGPREVS